MLLYALSQEIARFAAKNVIYAAQAQRYVWMDSDERHFAHHVKSKSSKNHYYKLHETVLAI
ncbi:hypothetical protein DP117_21125 [Brasilonema sp. UFV-L1]|nr:hypothetical protein [Brasilonema sp. UFV-L1]